MSTLRRIVCLAAILSAGGFSLRAAAEEKQSRNNRRSPNFVVILVDDLGWGDLGCYGNVFHETPNIDRLAADGMRFTNAYAACPVCSPTRASLLTGRYPATLGLTDFIPGHVRPWSLLLPPDSRQQLPLDETTFAEMLATYGYVSAAFGKWHVGGREYFPDRQGFSEFLVTQGSHFAPGFQTTPETDVPDGTSLAEALTHRTEQFLEQHRGEPFALYLAHHAVHLPLEADEQLIEKYQRKPAPGTGVNNPVYAAMVEHVDRSVGRILEKLNQLGLVNDTVVVFLSDSGGLYRSHNGTGPIVTSNAPLRGENGTLYEGGIRVPLIVRWPASAEPGSVSHTPVSSIDLFPTFAELAGCETRSARAVDGASLVPLLTGSGSMDRNALFWHYPHYHHGCPAGAVREGDFKLIENYEDNSLELYNLKDDPAEQHNLAEQHPGETRRLLRSLANWRASVGARMPTANPNYDPARAHEWGNAEQLRTRTRVQ